jgi:4-hydroxybenzoate polyprenyltransferase
LTVPWCVGTTERVPGILGRLLVYFRRMLPLEFLFPLHVGHSLIIFFGLHALSAQGPVVLTWRALIGCLNGFLLLVLMRMYDESKDFEHDSLLAAKGDPRFADRPLVTGQVQLSDLRLVARCITLLLVPLTLVLGVLPFLAYAFAFCLAWLSSRWFFWRAVPKQPLLAFATHLPVYFFLVEAPMVAIFVRDFGWARLSPASAVLVLASWMVCPVHEILRKIRLPHAETDFKSYSKVLGWRRAIAFGISWIVLSTVLSLLAASFTGFGAGYVIVLAGAASIAVGACALLLVRPTVARTVLLPYAVLFMSAAWVGGAAAIALHRGVGVSMAWLGA